MMQAPVDPRFALDSADQSDLVQKKLSIDAMRKRVSGGPSEDAKLREACEGFESIFLQKMWEQMRKNVKKEGYLHSKDEEAYQSMFDVELSKKMASAGGIGLADMLYEQLGQKLHNASKTTGSGAMREPLAIEPARPPKPQVAESAQAGEAPTDLYSEVAEGQAAGKKPKANPLEEALADLAAGRDPALDPANATFPMFDMQTGAPLNHVAGKMKEDASPRREIAVTPLPERVSPPGKARPSNAIRNVNRSARHARRNANAGTDNPQASPANIQSPANAPGALSGNAVSGEKAATLPVKGEVVSSYGRQGDDTGTNEGRSWNTGVAIAAAADSPVTAPLDGTVAFSGQRDGLGHVVIAHADGLSTHYTNVVSSLREGDAVIAGTEFARTPVRSPEGATEELGRMRYEVRRGELAINPENLTA